LQHNQAYKTYPQYIYTYPQYPQDLSTALYTCPQAGAGLSTTY